jgi:hypothetical protein
MVGDHYHEKWTQPPYNDWFEQLRKQQQQPQIQPQIQPISAPSITIPSASSNQSLWGTFPTKAEFDQLKKEVEEMKALLQKAIEYDKKNNEPDCQVEEKLATLKKVAELLGVSLDDILK